MPDRFQRLRRVSAFGLAAAVTMGSAVRAETLADVVAYAYETNPGVQAQRAAMRALDENYVQSRAGFAPNISASGGDTDYTDRRDGQQAHADTTSAAISVVQPVYTGGRVTSQVRASEAQIKAGRETLRRFELDLLQRVVTAYVDVRRDDQILQISRDTVLVLTKELADTQARFNVREVTLTDLSQAKARLAQARTQLLNAEAQLGVSRAAFLGVVGQNPVQLAPPPDIPGLPATPDAAFDAAEANNPQLQSARYAEASSRASVAVAKAARLPSVTARFDMQRTPFVPYLSNQYDNIRSVSVTVSQPLFSGGQLASQVRQAVETNNRDRLTIDDTRLQVLQQVSSAWEELVSLRQQLTTAQDEMKASGVAYAGVREEQKVALRTTIEVLNAELELSNAQQNLARIRAAEYISRVQLLTAMGVLTPDMLAKGVKTYDPSENFRRIRWRGVTPLELPVRAIEKIASPPIGPQPAASIAEAEPTASPELPRLPPDADAPIVSIYETILKPEGKKPPAVQAPASAPAPAKVP
jgi:outer membrane protein/S-layer protein transport system outer membrane protein